MNLKSLINQLLMINNPKFPKFPKFSRISVFRAFSLYQIQIQFNISFTGPDKLRISWNGGGFSLKFIPVNFRAATNFLVRLLGWILPFGLFLRMPALIRYSLRLTRRQRSITVLRRKPMEGRLSESGRAIFIPVLICLTYSRSSIMWLNWDCK